MSNEDIDYINIFQDSIQLWDQCNVKSLGDEPWMFYFTELFYATCPNVRIIISSRDEMDWAEHRISDVCYYIYILLLTL